MFAVTDSNADFNRFVSGDADLRIYQFGLCGLLLDSEFSGERSLLYTAYFSSAVYVFAAENFDGGHG